MSEIIVGDCRSVAKTLPERHYHAIVTSPPYWGLRDYMHPDQTGLEPTPEAYVAVLVDLFAELSRSLRDDGLLFLNLADVYASAWSSKGAAGGGANNEVFRPALRDGVLPTTQPNRMRSAFVVSGLKEKDLVGIPWRVALALQRAGWWLRSDIIWHKPNPTPSSARDRPTTAHEYVFMLAKSEHYFYDGEAIREPHVDPRPSKGGRTKMHGQASLRPRGNLESNERWYNPAGRNCRDVWTMATEPYEGNHYATFPRPLATRAISCGTSEWGCCEACGAPWDREVESVRLLDGEPAKLPPARNKSRSAPEGAKGIGHKRITTARKTKEWRPGCACNAKRVPCRVLDPFAGTGTVGEVAERLGRHSTLIEISDDSAGQAAKRTRQVGLFTGAAR